MSLHASSQPWTFPKLKNVSLFRLQRWTFFSVFLHLILTWFTNDLDSTDISNSVSSFPMTNCWGLTSSWELISGRPDLSRNVSSFLTDCAVPSRRVSPRWGRTCCAILQEASSSCVRLTLSSPLLKKTKHGRNPILNNLLPSGCPDRFPKRTPRILLKLKTKRTMASSRQNSS